MHHLRHHLNYQTQLRFFINHRFCISILQLTLFCLNCTYIPIRPASVPPSVPASTTGFVCFSVLTDCSVCASPPIGSALTTFTLPQKKHTPIKTLATPTVNLRIAKRSTLLLFSNMMLPSYLFTYTLSPITILCSDCCYFIQNLLKNTLGSKYPNVSLLLRCIPSNIIIAKFISQLFTIALLINCLLLLIILTPHPIHIF